MILLDDEVELRDYVEADFKDDEETEQLNVTINSGLANDKVQSIEGLVEALGTAVPEKRVANPKVVR